MKHEFPSDTRARLARESIEAQRAQRASRAKHEKNVLAVGYEFEGSPLTQRAPVVSAADMKPDQRSERYHDVLAKWTARARAQGEDEPNPVRAARQAAEELQAMLYAEHVEAYGAAIGRMAAHLVPLKDGDGKRIGHLAGRSWLKWWDMTPAARSRVLASVRKRSPEAADAWAAEAEARCPTPKRKRTVSGAEVRAASALVLRGRGSVPADEYKRARAIVRRFLRENRGSTK